MSTEFLETCRGFNKCIIEEILCQIGYLPELYEDARSENIKFCLSIVFTFRCM